MMADVCIKVQTLFIQSGSKTQMCLWKPFGYLPHILHGAAQRIYLMSFLLTLM